MKNTLYALIAFIVVVLIATAYQLHITKLTEKINTLSNNVVAIIEEGDFEKAESVLSELETLWDKNYKILMGFQDHSAVNDASVSLSLAINCLKTKKYNQISDNLISFTSILNELASENIPSIENIL